jgi:hypothetical protein
VALNLAPAPDPFAPELSVLIESRPSGSYVTVEVIPNALLRDLSRVMQGFASFMAILVLAWFAATTEGLDTIRAASAVGAIWSAALWGAWMGQHAIEQRAARELDPRRVQSALRRALI